MNLVVPDPDLSKYVSLEQLGELLKAKADKANTYTKSNIDDIHSKSYFRKQGIDEMVMLSKFVLMRSNKAMVAMPSIFMILTGQRPS